MGLIRHTIFLEFVFFFSNFIINLSWFAIFVSRYKYQYRQLSIIWGHIILL
jgi:hypothetical protein